MYNGFILTMKSVQKVLRLKIYLSKQKETMNKTLIFMKIVTLALNTLIPVSFPFVKALLVFIF